MTAVNTIATTSSQARLAQISHARTAVLQEGRSAAVPHWDGAWIERSWRRCLDQGLAPMQRVAFDLVPEQAPGRLHEAHHVFVAAARPVMERISRALSSTGYFAILTNDAGVVVDAHGPIDRRDPRAQLITRVGVDLSERAVGTTAIGAALAELKPVWLHRGEHFFDDTGCYSCAGAPIFAPDGRCAGMLDLTGIDAVERTELKHLAAQAARGIENALARAMPHRLLLRLNWPGRVLGSDDDGLLVLDGEGWVLGSNSSARELISDLQAPGSRPHCSELFAASWQSLFDEAQHAQPRAVEMPLWSGLRLSVLPVAPGEGSGAASLRDVETALIRQAVAQARGNVAAAAKVLGISRATVYRKLARKAPA
jgi:sigma-54 dependent transcriptional regulator, acetoin dehydrogenase operon transcriptional activator AcoR